MPQFWPPNGASKTKWGIPENAPNILDHCARFLYIEYKVEKIAKLQFCNGLKIYQIISANGGQNEGKTLGRPGYG